MKKIMDDAKVLSPRDFIEVLPERLAAPKFPLDALGEILGEAAKRLAYHVQTGEGLAGQSVLAAASLVAQSFININRGVIGSSPVSLFCLSIAESGDRKSTLDRLALAPLREYEKYQRDLLVEDEKKYRSASQAWEVQRQSILNSVKGKQISDTQRDELAQKLSALEDQKPKEPPRPNLTFSEPTAEGIWHHFTQGKPTAGLFSDEGISFFGGHGMTAEARGRMIYTLSKLWDGDPITRTRGSQGESGTLADRRLSAHLMVQPIVANQVLADPLLQGQGFLARFLICNEKSIAGTRFLNERNISKGVKHDPFIAQYWQCLTNILKKPVPIDFKTGGLDLRIMELSGDALETWIVLHDGIEKEIASGGAYECIKAFASKAAEHAARIAAVLAFIEQAAYPTTQHIERAAQIISYYLESMVVYVQNANQEEHDFLAGDLLTWIKNHGNKISSNDFQKISPVSIRQAKKARRLLKILTELGYLRVTQHGRNRVEKTWEVINHD